MSIKFKLTTKRLFLRNFREKDDFSNYFEMLKKQSKKYLAVNHHETKKKDIFLKIKDYEGILVAIFLKDKKVNIGTVGLSAVNKKNSSCNIGILIHNKYKRRGYAFEAMERVIKYSHLKLDIKNIYLWVKKNNLDAINLYKKLGFNISKSKKKYSQRVKFKQPVLFMLKKKN